MSLILAGEQDLGRIVGKIDTLLGGNPLWNRFAIDHSERGAEKDRPQERIALDRGIEFAVDHGLKRIADGVNGNNDDVFSMCPPINPV